MIYKSCDWINGGMDFRQNSIVLCCFTYMQGYQEYELVSNYNGGKIDWNKFFQKKHELIEIQKNNQSAIFCENCIYQEERDWDDDDTINCMIFNHWTNCNSACIYCYFGQEHDFYNKQSYYDVIPILEDMEANGILKVIPSSFVSFGGGEPTLLKNFDRIIQIIKRNNFPTIRINSSGILFSDTIAESLEDNTVNVCISPDAGSKDMYLKIKRVNCFDVVWDNINKYITRASDSNNVKVKYIIIPNINSTKKDIDDFFKMADKNKVSSVCLSVEKNWLSDLEQNKIKNNQAIEIYDLMTYFETETFKRGFELEIYSEGLSFKEFIREKYSLE